MSAGTVLAQSINVVVQPILTRLVTPDVLGIYSYIVSLATMIIPVASLKIDMLIVSEEDDSLAQYITDVCIIIVTLLSFVYCVILSIMYFGFGTNMITKYGYIVFFVPLIVFTNGIRFLFISYNNRYRQYKVIAGIGLLRECARAVIQVLSGVLHFGVIGQLTGYAAAPIFGFSFQTKQYFEKLHDRNKLTFELFKTVLYKGKNQILYLVPAQFINSFSSSFVTICITSLYSAKSLGYYSAGSRLLEIPIIFLAANVSKVCFKEISEKVSNKEVVMPILVRIISVLSLMSIVIFGILFLIAPQLAEFIFGNGYYTAGLYIKCLCVMYAVRIVSTSFSGLFTVFDKQYYEFLLNVFLVAVAFGIYFYCKFHSVPIETYLWMIGFGYTFMYVLMLIGYIVLCLNHDKKVKVINNVQF